MEGNQNNPEKTEKKEKTKEKPRKRSESPVASKEELMAKRIELIVYVGNLPTSWKEDDIWKFF